MKNLRLAQALNGISVKLHDMVASVQENARQVSKVVENVNEITQSAASAAEEMSTATELKSVAAIPAAVGAGTKGGGFEEL